MSRSPTHFDWHALVDEQDERTVIGTRQRLRWILAFYGLLLTTVLGRAAQLELSDGENFREWAARPVEKTAPLRAERGRILARDGTVLAADHVGQSLAVQYRYLETPPDARWLRRQARTRLTSRQRRDPQLVREAEAQIKREVADLHRRLATLCDLSDSEWRLRTARIQARITSLAEKVNARRLARYEAQTAEEQTENESLDEAVTFASLIKGMFAPPERLPPAEVVIAEQAAYHRVVDELGERAVQAIAAAPDAFPGTRLVGHTRRTYPLGPTAANLLGHVGAREDEPASMVNDAEELNVEPTIGLMGSELQLESLLAGQDGLEGRTLDRRNNILGRETLRAPQAGRDVTLSIDPVLQRSAEQLLDRFAQRARAAPVANAKAGDNGGAIVVLDLSNGEILAAASEPRFDPNWFAAGDVRVTRVLNDPRHPLVDRAARMAIAPGSVFKPLVALALVERGLVDPKQSWHCQGHLETADQLRCQIYRAQGIGHGDITLGEALAQSCNVFFCFHATRLGGPALLEWADRLGFGREPSAAGPDALAGRLPTAAELRETNPLQAFAIGQGAFTATPLEVVQLYAAIATGRRITPRLVRTDDATNGNSANRDSTGDDATIAGLSETTLAAVRAGLRQVIDDPSGTGYAAVRIEGLPLAGKTGTAETGGEQADHAWFAGYAPADAPRVAFVVALEHGGSGATSAGSLARHLLLRMRQLGYFGPLETADQRGSGETR